MDNLLFSAVIPVYNIEKYLGHCIESLLGQTYQNIEIILIDDGSTDNSPDLCDEYAKQDNRIIVIHKKNGGVASARLAGAEIASGSYIACIDGDDWLDKRYFAKFAEIINQYKPDIAVCSYYLAGKEEIRQGSFFIRPGIYRKKEIQEELFPVFLENEFGKSIGGNIWGTVIRKNLFVFQQKNIDMRIKIGEDNVCIKSCMFFADSIYYSNEPLYYYRMNLESVTKGHKTFDWKRPELVGKHFEKTFDTAVWDFQDQIDRVVVHSLFNVAVSQFYVNRSYKKVVKEIREHIQEPYYARAIKRCKYKSLKGKMALIALRYQLVVLMELYCHLYLMHRW